VSDVHADGTAAQTADPNALDSPCCSSDCEINKQIPLAAPAMKRGIQEDDSASVNSLKRDQSILEKRETEGEEGETNDVSNTTDEEDGKNEVNVGNGDKKNDGKQCDKEFPESLEIECSKDGKDIDQEAAEEKETESNGNIEEEPTLNTEDKQRETAHPTPPNPPKVFGSSFKLPSFSTLQTVKRI
jgi:hypothetical protein